VCPPSVTTADEPPLRPTENRRQPCRQLDPSPEVPQRPSAGPAAAATRAGGSPC